MIFDILFLVGALLLHAIYVVANTIGFFVPPEWNTLLTTLFSYVTYIQGYIPLYPDPSIESGLARTIGLITIINWTIAFAIARYGFHLLIKWFPFPHMFRFGVQNDTNSEPLDLRGPDRTQGNVVDLRRGPRKTRRYLRDIH